MNIYELLIDYNFLFFFTKIDLFYLAKANTAKVFAWKGESLR